MIKAQSLYTYKVDLKKRDTIFDGSLLFRKIVLVVVLIAFYSPLFLPVFASSSGEKWESRKTILSNNQGYTYNTYALDDTESDYLKTLLEEFGLPEKTTLSELKAKWKEHVLKYTPDNNKDGQERFIKYNDLSQTLPTGSW
jgi:hypothetical protein